MNKIGVVLGVMFLASCTQQLPNPTAEQRKFDQESAELIIINTQRQHEAEMAQPPATAEAVPYAPLPPLPVITLREYYAGQALAGWLARGTTTRETAVTYAYAEADAMLREEGARR